MKLTKNTVAALKSDKPDHVFWDDDLPGFGCRLRGGSKSWLIQYRIGQQQRRESFGDIRRVTLEDARKIARQRFAQIELGHDPAAAKAKARAAAATARLTLGSVSERYLDAKRDVLRPNSHRDAARYFATHWAPLRNRPIETITRTDIAAGLQEIAKASGRVAAARARANLSALFSWAMKEGLCEANPVISTNDPAAGIKPRDRVLTDHEVKVIWNACGDDDFDRVVRLLILTGCRRQEIGGLEWNKINFDTGVLTIPAERTKNGRALELALPPMALNILRSTPRRRDYVFGDVGAGFTSWSNATAALKQRIGVPLAPWRLHDLRRTAATRMAEIGIMPHIIEAILNHVSGHKGGVAGIYNRAAYAEQTRIALAKWADHIEALVTGKRPSTVVKLPNRRIARIAR
jgi:integrase